MAHPSLSFDRENPGPVRSDAVRVLKAGLRLALCFVFLSRAFSPVLHAQDNFTATPTPKPAVHLDLSVIGYHQPSRMDRLSERESSVSIDFVDANHVLLTFDAKKLVKRLPSCPPDHQDRMVHAAILELTTGKVVKEGDWYLHDRRRYLWALSPGTFLLRQLNDLYVVDSDLHKKLLLSSPKALLWVSVTPDRNQIIVETEKEPDPATEAKAASAGSSAAPEREFVAQFLDAKGAGLQRTILLDKPVDLSGTNAGYVDLVRKGDIWLIRFGPNRTQRHNIARVKSQTEPAVFYPSSTTLLIGHCPSPACDYGVSSFTLTGHRLWRQHWSHYRVFPVAANSWDDSRFAVSTLRITPPPAPDSKSTTSEDNPEDVYRPQIAQRDVFEEDIQILETASGTPVLSLKASPAVESGQNFSLSPDGRRFAVLQGSALEVFDLPEPSKEEQAKFAAIKTDVPHSYALDSPLGEAAALDAATAQASSEISTTEAPDTAVNASSENGEDSNAAADSDETDPPISSADANSSASGSPATITEQELESKAGPLATFKISTRAVAVDVVVTDAKGHPVTGLELQDFRLSEDGKPQQIRFFRQISDTSPAEPPTPPLARKPNPNVFSNEAQSRDGGAVTLVLFDMLNTPSQDQVYARQQLIKFLESKPKNSEFALCTLSGGPTHLRLIQGFTPDETMLLAAARGKKDVPQEARWRAAGAATRNSVSIVGDLAQEGRSSGFQNLLGAIQGMQAEQLGTDTDRRVGITMDSLMLLGRYLSGIPGRKNVVWLSGSFPVAIAAPDGVNDSAAGNRNYSEKIRQVTNVLAEAQIAVYPVDVRGLLAGGLSADTFHFATGPPADQPAMFGAKILAPESSAAPRGLDELDQQATERGTLGQVATATGGKAFYSSNAIKDAIATAVEQGSNYYLLTYSPTNKVYNGKFRKIKVVIGDKKYSLHYRQGYFAEEGSSAAKDAEMARRTRAVAMQHGSPPSRQILFSVNVVPVGNKRKVNHIQIGEVVVPSMKPLLPPIVDAQHYSIDYSFLGSQLHFIPQPDAKYRNVLTLMVASFDGDGTMLTGISHVGISDLEPAVYKAAIGGEFRLHEEADVPISATSLRLGIQDQMSSYLGTVEIPLPVPPVPGGSRKIKQSLPPIEPD